MRQGQRRLADYLAHILEAISRIEDYVAGKDAAGFLQDRLVQDAVIRNLEVIGEASRNIERDAPDFAASHPELPLAIAYRMRNALTHGYFNIDLDVVWATIQRDLPRLREQVNPLLEVLAEQATESGESGES